MSTAKFDATQALAEFVPGAIAGDIVGGGPRDVVVGGAVSLLGAQFIFTNDESAGSQMVRAYFRKAPYLGLGAGYAAARYAGLDAAPALGIGLLGAMAMMALTRTRAPKAADNRTDVYAGEQGELRSWAAVSDEAPQAPPAAQYNITSPFAFV